MSWQDPQFYVVTAITLWAAWILVRPFVGRRRSPQTTNTCPKCDGCAASQPAPGVAGKISRLPTFRAGAPR